MTTGEYDSLASPAIPQRFINGCTDLAEAVADDFRDSRLWTTAADSPSNVWHSDPNAAVPPELSGIRAINIGWKYSVAVPTTYALHGLAWMLRSPIRTVVLAGIAVVAKYTIATLIGG